MSHTLANKRLIIHVKKTNFHELIVLTKIYKKRPCSPYVHL